jgi:hypothetical protein
MPWSLELFKSTQLLQEDLTTSPSRFVISYLTSPEKILLKLLKKVLGWLESTYKLAVVD